MFEKFELDNYCNIWLNFQQKNGGKDLLSKVVILIEWQPWSIHDDI